MACSAGGGRRKSAMMMTIRSAKAAAFFVLFAGFLVSGVARAQSTAPSLASTSEFRVCGDPANLPFSNQAGEGFENKIAALFAGYLHEPVTSVWFPQIIGFYRNTLFAHRCDVVMGTVAGGDMVDTTTPYYHTGYVIVTRAADNIASIDLGDPVFSDKKIGLIAKTPPTDTVARHHLLAQVTPYNLTVDTRVEAPAKTLLLDLVAGKIDVGLVWGPFAGYYIKHDNLPLAMAFLPTEAGGPRLDYRIAMGVRPSDVTFRRTLNALIQKHQDEITAILRDYGIPLLDEQGNPLKP